MSDNTLFTPRMACGNEATITMLREQLDQEREKFTRADQTKMQELIDQLVAIGEYPSDPTPAMAKYGYSILTMVECYGSDWHRYRGWLNCPHCQADLRNLESGPPFKRELGRTEYDRTQDWWCPDCGKMIATRERPDNQSSDWRTTL